MKMRPDISSRKWDKTIPNGLEEFMHMLVENATEGLISLDDLCSMYGFDWDEKISDIEIWFKKFGVKIF